MNQKAAAKATNDPYIDQNLTLMSPAGDACYGKTVSVWMLLANGCNNCFPFQGNAKHEGAHSFSNSLQNYIPAIKTYQGILLFLRNELPTECHRNNEVVSRKSATVIFCQSHADCAIYSAAPHGDNLCHILIGWDYSQKGCNSVYIQVISAHFTNRN